MKNVLYSTTALVAAGMLVFSGGDAMAAAHAKKAKKKASKMKIKVGGFFKTLFGFSEQDSKFESTANSTSRIGYDSFDIKNDSEIYFTGSTRLDNGMTVSVVIQMEGEQSQANGSGSDNAVDESYMKLTGAFGDIRLGTTKQATFVLKNRAPSTGTLNHDDAGIQQWIMRPAGVSAALAAASTHIGGNDNMKLVYITNLFAGGFRVGASYQPSGTNSASMPQTGGNSGTQSQRYDIGLSYKATHGAVKVGADIAYDEVHGTAANSTNSIRGGINLGFAGITVGGSYKTVNNLDSSFEGTANSDEFDAFDLGISYATGPFRIALSGISAEMPFASGTPGDDEMTSLNLGISYSMGPGVSLLGSLLHREYQNETSGDALDNDGWAVIGGIKVSF